MKARIRPLLIALLALSSLAQTTLLAATKTSDQWNHPGGIVQLRLPKDSPELPLVKFGLHEPVIVDEGESWRVLVGIALGTLPGDYMVYVKTTDAEAESLKFAVVQRPYPVKEARLGRAIELRHSSYSDLDFVNSTPPALPLRYPVEPHDQWSSDFGHLVAGPETDIVTAQNFITLTTTALAPVLAPQNAIVSRITLSEQQLATVYLDHGRGLYSVISGVANLVVKVGDGVVSGAVIGKLPARSSVTEPHTLYWQCIMNGAYVDPAILAQL